MRITKYDWKIYWKSENLIKSALVDSIIVKANYSDFYFSKNDFILLKNLNCIKIANAKQVDVKSFDVELLRKDFLLWLDAREVFKQEIKMNFTLLSYLPPIWKVKILSLKFINTSRESIIDEIEDESDQSVPPDIHSDVRIYVNLYDHKDVAKLHKFQFLRVEKLFMIIPNIYFEDKNQQSIDLCLQLMPDLENLFYRKYL